MIPHTSDTSGGRPSPIRSGTGSDLLNEPGPVLPVSLRTLIRLEDAGDPVVFGFFSLSPGDITVVSIIPHHLLSPVRDVGTHGGQPLKGIEDLFLG